MSRAWLSARCAQLSTGTVARCPQQPKGQHAALLSSQGAQDGADAGGFLGYCWGMAEAKPKDTPSPFVLMPTKATKPGNEEKSFWGSFPMPSALGPGMKHGFPLHHILPACLENS